MTIHSFPRSSPLKLLALAATSLVVFPSCSMPMAAAEHPHAVFPRGDRQPANRPAAPYRPPAGRSADPRYRPATDFSELQAVAAKVAKASGREFHWHLALGDNPGPLVKIRSGLENSTIFLHPVAARTVPPNTWAFLFGHEFAHRVENLGSHSQSNPANELKADIAGARYAMAAGYRLEAFLGWVLTEPNGSSASHGSLHQRVRAIAAHFGIPQNVIQAEARRYSDDRATH